LREFRIRGVSNNLAFLENVIMHPLFTQGTCTTQFIDTTPDLFQFKPKQDRATKLLEFLGDVTVNGQPELKGRSLPAAFPAPAQLPAFHLSQTIPTGTRDQFKLLGAEGFRSEERRVGKGRRYQRR